MLLLFVYRKKRIVKTKARKSQAKDAASFSDVVTCLFVFCVYLYKSHTYILCHNNINNVITFHHVEQCALQTFKSCTEFCIYYV